MAFQTTVVGVNQPVIPHKRNGLGWGAGTGRLVMPAAAVAGVCDCLCELVVHCAAT